MYVTQTLDIPPMDSWDLDNLKYLKRNRKQSTHSEEYFTDESINASETISWFTSSTDMRSASGSNYNKEILGTEAETVEFNELFFTPPHEYRGGFEVYEDEYTDTNSIDEWPASPANDSSSLLAPLENCCYVDVVIVRNESVFASTLTRSSSSLTEDEFRADSAKLSDQEGNPKHDVEPLERNGNIEEDQRSCSMNYQELRKYFEVGGRERERDNGRIVRSAPTLSKHSEKFGSTFYFGEKQEFKSKQELSPADELNLNTYESGYSPEPSPQSPSPYYVRLRKDLYPIKRTVFRQPLNFGMDMNGQLVIDYSPNWENLEKYVGGLVLSC